MSPEYNIAFCRPGATFTTKWVRCWTNLAFYCAQNGIGFVDCPATFHNIHMVRDMCLNVNVATKDVKPFHGELDYTHMMWIDSDLADGRQYLAGSAFSMADIVLLRRAGRDLHILMAHCKFSSEDLPGARVDDLYEVCGQAIRSHKARSEAELVLKNLIRRETRPECDS